MLRVQTCWTAFDGMIRNKGYPMILNSPYGRDGIGPRLLGSASPYLFCLIIVGFAGTNKIL